MKSIILSLIATMLVIAPATAETALLLIKRADGTVCPFVIEGKSGGTLTKTELNLILDRVWFDGDWPDSPTDPDDPPTGPDDPGDDETLTELVARLAAQVNEPSVAASFEHTYRSLANAIDSSTVDNPYEMAVAGINATNEFIVALSSQKKEQWRAVLKVINAEIASAPKEKETLLAVADGFKPQAMAANFSFPKFVQCLPCMVDAFLSPAAKDGAKLGTPEPVPMPATSTVPVGKTSVIKKRPKVPINPKKISSIHDSMIEVNERYRVLFGS